MIALAIMVITLSAVVQVIFGNQKALLESQMNADALSRAQTLLEQEESLGRQDFALVTSATTTDGTYQTSAVVDTWPQDRNTTKRVTVITTWNDEGGVSHSVTLSTLVTNYQNPIGADTCDLPGAGAVNAGITNYQLTLGMLLPWVAPLGHSFAMNNPIAALDVYQGLVAIGVASTSVKTNDKLFLFGVADLSLTPQYLGSIDNATNTTDGINAIRVAGKYVYVASAHDPNFKTCKPSANCAQLQIFDISNPSNILNATNFLLPTSSPPYVWGNVSSANQAVGKSIFYANDYVYLGLTKTAHGPEFNIIDVHDPLHPVWSGGYMVGSTINAVMIKNGFAYLATDDSTQDLIVLDVHNPNNPTLVGLYNAPDPSGWSNGKSLSIIGNTLYLGLTYSTSSPELYELDISNPKSPKYVAALNTGSSVVAVASRSGQSYFVTSTTGQLETLDTSDVQHIATTSTQALPGVGVSLDCERGLLYAASNSAGRGYLSIINATP